MDLTSTPVQNPDILWRKTVNDEMVLVNADTGASLALMNRKIVTLWELVGGKRSVRDIIDGLKNRFRIVPESVADDIPALLELLIRDGFIGFEFRQKRSSSDITC